MLSSLCEPLTELVHTVRLHPPTIPYISNVTGTWITAEQATDPGYWAQHMCQTVHFSDGVGTLMGESDYLLVEVGPGSSLCSFVKQHPACGSERMADVFSTLPANYDQQSAQACLLIALGKLWLMGAQVDWNAFYAGERRHRILLPTYPFERLRYWLPASIRPQSRVSTPTALITREADISDWFYQPVWEAVPISTTKPSALLQRPVLVFEDACGLNEQITQQLVQRGYTIVFVRQGEQFARQDNLHFSIRAGNDADYVALYSALKEMGPLPGTILHCWSLSQEQTIATGPEYFRLQQEVGFYSLLFLTQAIAAQVDDTPVQVLIISNAVQSVNGQEIVSPEKATILGACRVISQEHPHILCRSIDVETSYLTTSADGFIAAIMEECTLAIFDPVVAYHSGQRWIETYRKQQLETVTVPPFRQHGVYLITGALGGNRSDSS